MRKKKIVIFSFLALIAVGAGFVFFTLFFDQAILVRRGTTYCVNVNDKIVALTFDDGPSTVWTPKILDELKKLDAKATFFMVGKHIEKYPLIAKRVADEGHDIGVHTYAHHIILFQDEHHLAEDLKITQAIIKNATGKTTTYFRPPKAWISDQEKQQIKALGYTIILWTLNSKDWVTFDDKYIVQYLVSNIRPGDIILLHDGGGFFGHEGGNREETVKALPRLVERLREKGYRFVTITELLKARE